MTTDPPTAPSRDDRRPDLSELGARAAKAAGLGMWRLDLADGVPRWSDEIYTIFDVVPVDTATDFAFMLGERVHPDDRERVRGLIEHPPLAALPPSITFRVVHGDGTVRTVEARGAERFDDAGRLVCLEGYVQDVTEHIAAEDALRDSEHRFRRILDNMQDAYFQADLEGRLVLVSPSAAVMYRFSSPEEMIGLEAVSLYADPDDRAGLFERLRLTGRVTDFAGIARRADGSVFHASMNAQYVVDAEGVAIGVEGLVRDISDRVAAADALRQSEQKFSDAFRLSPDSININRLSDGMYIDINEGFTRLTGYTPGDVEGKTSADISIWVDPDDRNRLVAGLRERQEVVNLEARFRRKDGSIGSGLMSARVMVFNGEPCILSVTRDITEMKAAEAQIRELNEDLERRIAERTADLEDANDELMALNAELDRAMRVKSDFIASMSHELRTPLNSILGFSGMMLQGLAGPLNDEQTRQMEMVRSSGEQLLALVNDVLDLAKIESGRVELERAPFDPAALVAALAEQVRPIAHAKGIEVRIDAGNAPASMVGDPDRIAQVLLNFLSNAIKFTDTGAVSIAVEPRDGAVAFVVADTGCGIPVDERASVFEEFYQVRSPGAPKSLGTGLGLAIARRLAETMRGSIGFCSEVGVGTTFTLVVPRG